AWASGRLPSEVPGASFRLPASPWDLLPRNRVPLATASFDHDGRLRAIEFLSRRGGRFDVLDRSAAAERAAYRDNSSSKSFSSAAAPPGPPGLPASAATS